MVKSFLAYDSGPTGSNGPKQIMLKVFHNMRITKQKDKKESQIYVNVYAGSF